MCIAIYKPMGVEFPYKRTLKRCFMKNPDGAGFMVANGSVVEIHKGFMGFRSFWRALRSARIVYGDDVAYVMHFRISTQGGVRQDGCHPFPLSKDMGDLRKLDTYSDIGVAHNGVIDLCTDWSSTYSSYYTRYGSAKKQVDYSDTMKFITEYLSLIIRDRDYYKHQDTLDLIAKLCDSRLAILDASGHCELIGKGWEQDHGVWYSNGGYKEDAKTARTTYTYTYDSKDKSDDDKWSDANSYSGYKWSYDDDSVFDSDGRLIGYEDPYDWYLGADGMYDFSQTDCPATIDGDDSYCGDCKHLLDCWDFAKYAQKSDDMN